MSRHLILAAGVLAISLSAAACKPAPAPAAGNDEVPATAAELAPPLTPAGAPVAVTAVADDDGLQTAAGVQQVEYFSEQVIHLFGVSSGDPGPNGLHIYATVGLAGPDAEIFPIADAEAYEVVSVQPGKIGIKLTSADYSPTGEASEKESRIIVAWTEDPEGAAPTSLTVTPAT